MTAEQETILMIKGAISELTQEQQASVYACHDRIMQLINEDTLVGGVAIALIGAEMQAALRA